MAKILIVDDSEDSLTLITRELERAGFAVTTALGGAEALDCARADPPDLILLDGVMPDIDGFETCQRLKADPALASIPVLMWTALDSTDDIVRGLEAGAQDYVTKPFVPEVLHARIRSALRGKLDHDTLLKMNQSLEHSRRAASDALTVRTEFLSHVSHELRTPLASLNQLLAIVLDGLAGPISAEQREYLGICLRNARQLRSMISDLMDVTRVQNGKLRVTQRPLELSAVIEDVIETERSAVLAKGLTLTAHLDTLPAVLADDVRIRQVLTNLIDNAIKYSAEGGKIELCAGRDARHASFVRIAVRDTGCGVAPEARQRIFEYMQQESDDDWRSRKGLGIGLYLCKELVTRHGGEIWVESEPGKGSTFCFTLPEFDFAKLIAPAITSGDGCLHESTAVIRVDLGAADAHASHGVPEALSRRAHHLVESCLFPRDVMLPRFLHAGTLESYFAVAATNAPGMRSLCARIRGQLAAWAELREARIEISVRGTLLHRSDEDRAKPDAFAEAAREIERWTQIDSHWSE
jgi:signal transduction histidine kinase